MTMENLNRYIDHTILKPEATEEEVAIFCKEAIRYQFQSVCVNPCRVAQAFELLKESGVLVCTVIGFPLGANTPPVKCAEAIEAVKNGASEVDMVLSIGALKDRNWDYVRQDIAAVVEAVSGKAVVKVILETCLLTEEEIRRACLLSKEAGAHYVKTSTGFSRSGATEEAVSLMRKTVGNSMGVKASGGIRDRDTALRMIEAGASRIGTSAGIVIMEGGAGE